MLERAIVIEGLLRIIRDGNPLPETYTLLSNKLVELAEEAMMLEERAAAKDLEESSDAKIEHQQNHFEEAQSTNMHEDAEEMTSEKEEENYEESAEEEIIDSIRKEVPTEIPVIVMTNDPNETTEEQKRKSTNSSQPIVISMDAETSSKENTSKETEMTESLSEAEDEIESIADVEVKISRETETYNRPAAFPEIAEEEDDILFNFEEDDDIGVKNESKNQVEEPNQKIVKNETAGVKRQKKLKSAFSLNDRFLYARELFEGNMKMFDSTLDFLEGIEDYSIIEDYFYNELEWDPENGAVASFMEILRPQFND